MGVLYLGTQKVSPATVAGGGNYQTKSQNITSAEATVIVPDSGYDAMTSVTVTPQLQLKTVTPSKNQQTISPDTGKVGLSSVTVNAVTSAIDSNISAGNIKNGISILGVTGSYIPTLQTKTVTPTTSQQTVRPDSGQDGLSQVTINAVTSAIDSDIVAGNIKNGVEILGVTGTYSGEGGGYQIGTASKTTGSSRSTSIQFTDLKGQPQAFAIIQATQVSASTSYVYVNAITYDGSTKRIAYNNKRSYMAVSTSYFNYSYSNGTLTVTTSSSTYGGYFCTSCSYQLIYIY